MLGEKEGKQLQVIKLDKLKIPISLFEVMAIFSIVCCMLQDFIVTCCVVRFIKHLTT